MEINPTEKRKERQVRKAEERIRLTLFQKKVYSQTKKIPKGKVITYGQIAKLIKNPNSARAVGNALHKNPFKKVFCHRVVNSKGELAKNFKLKGREGQKKILLSEDVKFKTCFKVDLKKHLLKT